MVQFVQTALQTSWWFDSRWCLYNFSLTQSSSPHNGPKVKSGPERNEHQEYILGGKGGQYAGLTT